MSRICRLSFNLIVLLFLATASAWAQPGQATGSLTVDRVATPLTHAVRTTRPNLFSDFFSDTVVVLSNRPLTMAEAADGTALLARAQQGDFVALAVRFDGRPKRGQLFNVAVTHRGLTETALLPDVWFKYSYKAGVGSLSLATREFSGRYYEVTSEFTVPVPVETQTSADAPAIPLAGLPPPSKTDADRAAASALLIAALQEGDEARSLAIVELGVDPNARDQKMQIPLINWAVLMCQPPVVRALVELKVDLSHQRLPGMTLLSEAMAACPDAVSFLRAGGAQ
ncbi:MAG TPA: hypothetical protein VNJ02_01500 [Vicinamibacterales bacterium]|nr:hypothetical protein [Vicinamibacterales bacterium]